MTRQPTPRSTLRRRTWTALLLAATVPLASPAAESPVSLDTGGREWIAPDFALTIELAPDLGESTIAVVLGGRDLTDLFDRRGSTLRYRSDLLPLPSGRNEVTVFRVEPSGEWVEIGTASLAVLTRAGFEQVERTPRLTLAGLAVVDEQRTPNDPSLPGTPDTGTLSVGGGIAVTRGGWRFAADADLLGVTEVASALRFDLDGEEADRLDLASWALRFQRQGHLPFELGLGHVSWTANRLLVGAHSSRGVSFSIPGSRASFALTATRGRPLVGWNDPLGLERSDDLVLGGEVRLQLLPERPGGVEVAVAWIDGELAALDPFGASLVTDRERSRGLGLALLASTPGQRLRLEALAARSRFDNPFDPTLAQGAELVAVEEEERDAFALSTELALIQNRPWGTHATSLTLALRHETVEPQYRSILASLTADRATSAIELRGQIGPLAAQLTRERSEDNLDDIPSILTTRTDRTAAAVMLPLAALRTSQAWPTVTLSLDRTDQRGLALPDNADFAPSHVPDQRSESANLQLDWTLEKIRWGYRLSASDQDNRQPGRELADFEARTHGWTFGWSPHSRLDLGFEVDRERSRSLEAHRTDRRRRLGVSLGWRPHDRLSFDGRYSRSSSEDDPSTSTSQSRLVDCGLAWSFGHTSARGRTVAGQLFVRYSDQELAARDLTFLLDTVTTGQTITAGLNLSLQ